MRLVAPLLVAAVLLTGCSSEAGPLAPTPSPSAPSPDQPAPTPTPAPTEDAAPIVASWQLGAPGVELPNGEVIVHCEGHAPMLCIRRDGVDIGLLQLFDYPLTPEERADSETRLEASLREWAERQYEWVGSDRAEGCGADYVVSREPVVLTRLGARPAVRLGFTGTEDGAVTEHVRSWATIVDGTRWVVSVEAASPDGCMASDELLVFDPAVLAELLPVLDRVVAGTPLPSEA
ncbi:MAG: hypothetical protein R3343_10485 [Nitriliruptorales bacterium]|nr:hypothetical protein [Nitriliruptorales bacterium]